MSSERSIEATGENVEEAIAKGLAELGVGPNDVIVEVLEEPSRGVFGLGAHGARVRLQLLNIPKPPPPPEVPPTPAEPPPRVAPQAPKPQPSSEPSDSGTPRAPRQNREPREQRRPPHRDADVSGDMEMASEEEDAESLFNDLEEIVSESDISEDATVGRVVLGQLLEKMEIRADIVVRRAGGATPPAENAPYILDVTGGSDLTRLIGKRGDTLAALQYITRLVTSRELQRRANVIVDVDGYKARRANMLKGLALRMADQAIERDRVVSLEPMPPHERRIIHLTLREREDVETRSVGEGIGRKVTIVPKSQT